MALDKAWRENNERLERIEKKLDALTGGGKAATPKVTKEQLMAIKGVGASTADEILKLLGK